MLDKLIRPGENPLLAYLLTYLLTYCLTFARRCRYDTSGKTENADAEAWRTGRTLELYLDVSNKFHRKIFSSNRRTNAYGQLGNHDRQPKPERVGAVWSWILPRFRSVAVHWTEWRANTSCHFHRQCYRRLARSSSVWRERLYNQDQSVMIPKAVAA